MELRKSPLPPGVLNVVPAGREAGAHLVGHPDNGQICWLSTRVLAPRSRYAVVVEAVTGLALIRAHRTSILTSAAAR